ncbi:MAG: FAD-binding protein [Bdellovibrionota bacterium]
MAERFSEVLVVGGGAAGVLAAVAARRMGASVRLVARAPGASGVSSGAVDLCADPLATPRDPFGESTDLKRNLIELLSRAPWHPFHQIGKGFDGFEAKVGHILKTMASCVKSLQDAGGLAFLGDGATNRARLTPAGTFKFTAYAQASSGGFSGEELRKMRPVFMELRGLPGAVAGRQAAVFDDLRGASADRRSFSAGIDLPEALGPHTNAVGLASLMDDEAFAKAVAEKMARAVPSGAELVILPPVLGLRRPTECAEIFKKTLPVPFTETLAVPPSVPGVRLDLAMSRLLASEQIEVTRGEVIPVEGRAKKLRWLLVKSGGQEEKFLFERLVLATGKFLGGGLRKEGKIFETLAALPVFWRDRRMESGSNEELFSFRYLSDQPAFSAGLRVDSKMRPVDERGEPLYENLFAAGSLLGGYDATSGPGGLGVAIVTGFAAGREASGK